LLAPGSQTGSLPVPCRQQLQAGCANKGGLHWSVAHGVQRTTSCAPPTQSMLPRLLNCRDTRQPGGSACHLGVQYAIQGLQSSTHHGWTADTCTHHCCHLGPHLAAAPLGRQGLSPQPGTLQSTRQHLQGPCASGTMHSTVVPELSPCQRR
jgi:hypothetical protein